MRCGRRHSGAENWHKCGHTCRRGSKFTKQASIERWRQAMVIAMLYQPAGDFLTQALALGEMRRAPARC